MASGERFGRAAGSSSGIVARESDDAESGVCDEERNEPRFEGARVLVVRCRFGRSSASHAAASSKTRVGGVVMARRAAMRASGCRPRRESTGGLQSLRCELQRLGH